MKKWRVGTAGGLLQLHLICAVMVAVSCCINLAQPSLTIKWEHVDDGLEHHGGRATPVLADLNGNGYQEIVACTDNLLKVYDHRGQLLWEFDLRGGPDCVFPDWWSFLPAVGDITGNGQLEIIISSTQLYSETDPTCNPCLNPECPDQVLRAVFYCLTSSGSLLWERDHGFEAAYTKPALYDLTGDGKLEIIYGVGFTRYGIEPGSSPPTENSGVLVLDYSGNILWFYETDEAVNSSPSVADITRDGHPEIVFGEQYAHPDQLYLLHVVNRQGARVWATFPIALGESSTCIGCISGSPALADITGDGYKEIIVGTDCGYLFCYDHAGALLWQAELPLTEAYAKTTKCAPSVADIDGDGVLEIVVGQGYFNTGGGTVTVLSNQGEVQWTYAGDGAVWSSPSLVDVSGNGQLEILVTMGDGRLVLLDCEGTLLDEHTFADTGIRSSPVVADVNRDGTLDVIVSYGVDGLTARWGIACLSTGGICPVGATPWPQYLFDGANTNSVSTVDTASVFRINSHGDVFADGSIIAASLQSGSADVAEWVLVSEAVEPGDVLEHDPANPLTYRKSSGRCSSLVAGVVSTQPGLILGTDLLDSHCSTTDDSCLSDRFYPLPTTHYPLTLLALAGIVPVKVTNEGGVIQPGDLLVASSTPGHAMRWDQSMKGCISLLGKALEPMSEENGVILVLLTSP